MSKHDQRILKNMGNIILCFYTHSIFLFENQRIHIGGKGSIICNDIYYLK
jgi:hypothetical protein